MSKRGRDKRSQPVVRHVNDPTISGMKVQGAQKTRIADHRIPVVPVQLGHPDFPETLRQAQRQCHYFATVYGDFLSTQKVRVDEDEDEVQGETTEERKLVLIAIDEAIQKICQGTSDTSLQPLLRDRVLRPLGRLYEALVLKEAELARYRTEDVRLSAQMDLGANWAKYVTRFQNVLSGTLEVLTKAHRSITDDVEIAQQEYALCRTMVANGHEAVRELTIRAQNMKLLIQEAVKVHEEGAAPLTRVQSILTGLRSSREAYDLKEATFISYRTKYDNAAADLNEWSTSVHEQRDSWEVTRTHLEWLEDLLVRLEIPTAQFFTEEVAAAKQKVDITIKPIDAFPEFRSSRISEQVGQLIIQYEQWERNLKANLATSPRPATNLVVSSQLKPWQVVTCVYTLLAAIFEKKTAGVSAEEVWEKLASDNLTVDIKKRTFLDAASEAWKPHGCLELTGPSGYRVTRAGVHMAQEKEWWKQLPVDFSDMVHRVFTQPKVIVPAREPQAPKPVVPRKEEQKPAPSRSLPGPVLGSTLSLVAQLALVTYALTCTRFKGKNKAYPNSRRSSRKTYQGFLVTTGCTLGFSEEEFNDATKEVCSQGLLALSKVKHSQSAGWSICYQPTEAGYVQASSLLLALPTQFPTEFEKRVQECFAVYQKERREHFEKTRKKT